MSVHGLQVITGRVACRAPTFCFLMCFLYNTLMTKVGVEQIGFNDAVATEPRFAFRRWFETWVDAVNDGNRDVWQPALLDVLTVTDLVDRDLGYEKFVSYMTSPPKQLRIPTVNVSVEDGLYVVRGSLELFSESMMIFEGTFEVVVHDIGVNDFKIFGMTCYPHFRVTT